MTNPEPPPTPAPSNELQPGDTYQEGTYLVFTAQYHLRRGYCCHSNCRHCPYTNPYTNPNTNP